MDDASFNELLSSIREGGAILRGEVPAARRTVVPRPAVRVIRERSIAFAP